MPHIHTEAGQHDTTASAIIVRMDGDEPRILLHMHKKHQILLQIGGHVELNETPWQAILHEITEESGYRTAQLTLLQPTQRIKSLSDVVLHPIPVATDTHLVAGTSPAHYHTDSIYVFTTNEAPAGAPGEDESQDLRWLTKQDLIQLNSAILSPDTKEVCMFVFDVCVPGWEIVELTDFAT